MKNIIINRKSIYPQIPDEVCRVVGSNAVLAVETVCAREDITILEEIRLHSGRCSSLVGDGHNFFLDISIPRDEIREILIRMCGGSLYAFADSIEKGFVSLSDGIRVGVCGRASVSKNQITGVYDIDTLNIRLPHKIHDIGDEICELLCNNSFSGGLLIYSKPGEGKTTLLRAVIKKLAAGYGGKIRRVGVVDSRSELCSHELDRGKLSVDCLIGYPKALGIEICTRTMNSEIIVCDEIGGEKEEADAIIAAGNCGVPLIATSHADNVRSLLNRSNIRALHKAAVFSFYIGIKRANGKPDYIYEITSWEAANELL